MISSWCIEFQFIVDTCWLDFCFCIYPDMLSPHLLLALLSGITSGSFRETIWTHVDCARVSCKQGKNLDPCTMYLGPENIYLVSEFSDQILDFYYKS